MRRKLSVEEVLEKIQLKHGDRLSLDISTYIDTQHKAKFTDVDYGSWMAKPSDIMQGKGHKLRAFKIISTKNSYSTGEIIERLKLIHGDIITIDLTTYSGVAKKARFIDKEYGEFWAKVITILRGTSHKSRGYDKAKQNIALSVDEFKEKLTLIHGIIIELDESTYINTKIKARFIDKEYGEFWSSPGQIIYNKNGHPKRAKTKRENTMLERYGVKNALNSDIIMEKMRATNKIRYGSDNVSQNKEIALKQARGQNNRYIKYHWKTREELVCQGSWEAKVIDYLNTNKIDFEWQPKVFIMPNGKTYRPDCYLIKEDKWIEVKGWMRKDAQIKWDWFQSIMPNSELWNKEKLKELKILF